jgi:membrane protein
MLPKGCHSVSSEGTAVLPHRSIARFGVPSLVLGRRDAFEPLPSPPLVFIEVTSAPMWREKLSRTVKTGRQALAAVLRRSPLFSPSLRYLFTTEVHAYAFSIAANAYLTFFPFLLILLTVCKRWLRWEAAYEVILQLVEANLPHGADSVIRTLRALVAGHQRLQVISVAMLLFTSSGVFLPLEVALNRVWGITKNRSFLRNQALSFGLALVVGLLALFSILLTAATQWAIMSWINWTPARDLGSLASRFVLEILSIPLLISIYFVIYFFIPNSKVPVSRVLPAAVVAGLLTEIGKFIYFVTLPMFRFREVYGPFQLSVTLVFWGYVGALILLFGAHLSVQPFWETALRLGRIPDPAASLGTEPVEARPEKL